MTKETTAYCRPWSPSHWNPRGNYCLFSFFTVFVSFSSFVRLTFKCVYFLQVSFSSADVSCILNTVRRPVLYTTMTWEVYIANAAGRLAPGSKRTTTTARNVSVTVQTTKSHLAPFYRIPNYPGSARYKTGTTGISWFITVALEMIQSPPLPSPFFLFAIIVMRMYAHPIYCVFVRCLDFFFLILCLSGK